MFAFYCIAFIEYMLSWKTLLDLLDLANLFSQNDYKRNDKIMYNYLKDKYSRRSKYWENWWNKKLFFRWNKT